MLEDVLEAIDNYDCINFYHFVKNISSEDELSVIDSCLLNNRDFDFAVKLEYGKKYKRKNFLSDLFNDIKLQYLYYSYEAIMYVAINELNNKEKYLYLVEAFLKVNDFTITNFILNLKKNKCYDEFVEYLKRSNSDEVKVKSYLYLNKSFIKF